jgi:TnpA family transposase
MPTRYLSDEQRSHYGRFAGAPSADQLARFFHLDVTDRELISQLRGGHSRLGFAIQLGAVRFLGAFPETFDAIPGNVVADLARQLGEPEDVDLGPYQDGRQRWRHVSLISEHYGFRRFEDDAFGRFRLARWLYALCWSGDDRPGLLIDRASGWLVANKVLLPGATTLERFVGRIRDRAQRRLHDRLVAALDAEQRARIAGLFSEADPEAFATVDALRTVPRRRTPTEFSAQLDRVDAIRAFHLRPQAPGGVPAASIERLARVARSNKPSAIAALREPRRTATVAAMFHTLEAAAQDDAAELAEALITDLIKGAESDHKTSRLRTLHDLDAAAILLREVGRLVMSDDALPLDDWREALFERIARQDLDAAMAEIDRLAKPRDARPYEELRASWRRARRLFSQIVNRIELGATPGGEAVKTALVYLKNRPDWSAAALRAAPTAAIPKPWKTLVLDDEGAVGDPKAYVFAIIDAWRAALKRRDIFVQPAIRYGDPRRGLLEGKTWESSRAMVCRALGRSLDADAELNGLSQLLDSAYRKVAGAVDANPDLQIELVDGKPEIKVAKLDRLDEPASLARLRPAVQALMPHVDVPGVMLEVMGRTEFAQAFTHLSERLARVEDFETSLCAALIAQACNIGHAPMIRPDMPALRRDRISWVDQNFIRPDTLAAANARVVAAHARLPIAALWGEGEVASADGVRFMAPTSAIHAGPNPKYYGRERGLTWYNMLSDQFSGLGGVVVPGTLRDSLFILALLLDQQTELQPTEIMTDTAAASDAVFGLFWLLGYQFSPRLADIGGAKLWRIDRKANYGPLNDIARGAINLALIRANWADLIRLAGSLKLGYLQAAGVMRMLQTKDRATSLARALSELGRIVKTLHILRYVDDKPFRRRVLTQLNRQELRHKLGRRVMHGNAGEIRTPFRLEQEEQFGALGLTLNAIVHWNAIYMQASLDRLRIDGWDIDPSDVSRLSPVSWRHINFLGRYDFSVPEPVLQGQLRPLAQPSSEWDL